MLDFHCHLNHPSLFLQRETLVTQWRHEGGRYIMIPGVSPEYNANMLTILSHPNATGLRGSLGLHPVWIAEHQDEDLCTVLIHNYVTQYVNKTNPRLCARGECGIDLYRPSRSTLALQQKMFRLQCHVARHLKLPLIIHSRDAFDETREVVSEFLDLKLYFHCRSYGIRELEIIYKKTDNVWFGITGMITYPKAHDLKKVLVYIPDASLVLETDAPYLAPQPLRGKDNTPTAIIHTYNFIAQERGMARNDLIALQHANRDKLYKIT